MILGVHVVTVRLGRIPRESGDDPRIILEHYWLREYSPRERG